MMQNPYTLGMSDCQRWQKGSLKIGHLQENYFKVDVLTLQKPFLPYQKHFISS